jgi:hypothetical protein
MMRFFLNSSIILIGSMLCGCDKPSTEIAKKEAPEVHGPISFNEHIQPILSQNCYHCHGPDSGTREPKKEPLRLDREKFAFEKRDDGQPVIQKGNSTDSLLIQRILSTDPDEVMPPPESHNQLTSDQKNLISRWVAQGAAYEDHWSFIPPKKAEPPVLANATAVENPVDAFIQEPLAKLGVSPAPLEDPRALIRRASLDLTGLLPDAAEVDAFVKNPSAAAYSVFVGKQFSTPAYAEHRTRYWLDYSRYADTHGLHFDNQRAIWPYRDYVIRAFAANKPYDQFVREQLAGDLISAKSADPLIATGYIRCNVSTNEGGTIPEEVHANNTRDRTEAFGATFLGLTVGCAACHDHKFDPTAQKDFYSLGAFFNNTAEKAWDENIAETKPILKIAEEAQRPAFDAAIARRSEATTAYEKLRKIAASRFTDWVAAGNKPMPISPANMELRLRLDEGKGDLVKNSAPAAKTLTYQADTNPLVWGEQVWLWPSARMEISTNLPLPDQGDFEVDQAFSASVWANRRLSGPNSTTGDGALIARMGDASKDAYRGWEMLIEKNSLMVDLIHLWPASAIRVQADGIPLGEWSHLGFSYDGSGKAEGVKIFINGQSMPVKIVANTLQPGQTIRNQLPLNVGQRSGSDRLKAISLQDLRLYRRTLSPDEFSRLPFQDLAAEILNTKPDPTTWSPQERFVVLDQFFLTTVDPEAAALRAKIAAADAEIDELGKNGSATLIARERPTPANAWVLNRGVYSARKELVSPATPEFLPGAHQATNRLELAEWLFKPENPLFARVTVNRIWQEVFGIGLVETADDFGIMGSRPSNQKLLDWLAVEFRESGWNIKHIYQLLLTSHTYRQSNQVTPQSLAADPANRLLSRGPRFRMDAEVLRDTALQASGLLSAKVGGPSVKSYQPEGIWEAVSMPESNTLHYQQDSGDALYRRSLYSFWKRFAPPPSLETFDAQAREVVCVRRARTNTPLQALVSMNDPQFFEAARKIAEKAILHGGDTSQRLQFLAGILLSRPLVPAEITPLTQSLDTFSKYYATAPQDAKDLLTTGAAPTDASLNPVELASWTMVANQLFNLDETLTK